MTATITAPITNITTKKYNPCRSRACSAWKETKREFRFTRKITSGAIQPPTSCSTCAKVAMVRSSEVVSGAEFSSASGMRSSNEESITPSADLHRVLLVADDIAGGAGPTVANATDKRGLTKRADRVGRWWDRLQSPSE